MQWIDIELVTGLPEIITNILDKYQLTVPDFDTVMRELKNKHRNHEPIHPVLHLNGVNQVTGQKQHFKALIWRNKEWQRIRLQAIAHQRQLYTYTKAQPLSFVVPDVIAFGADPTVWEIDEWVAAEKLPWQNHTFHQLDNIPDKIPDFIAINTDIQTITSIAAPAHAWPEFMLRLSATIQNVVERQVISHDRAELCLRFANAFEQKDLLRCKPVLTHGDYNPINVLFGKNGNYLLDFDGMSTSLRGESYARLWMFLSNEPMWQARLENTLPKVLTSQAELKGFVFFAIDTTMSQILHEFDTASNEVINWHELKHRAPQHSKLIYYYRQALYRLIDSLTKV